MVLNKQYKQSKSSVVSVKDGRSPIKSEKILIDMGGSICSLRGRLVNRTRGRTAEKDMQKVKFK